MFYILVFNLFSQSLVLIITNYSTSMSNPTSSNDTGNAPSISQPQKLIETFIKSLAEFNKRRRLSLKDLTVNNVQIHPYRLYVVVKKHGGFSEITQKQQWHLIAQQLGLPMDISIGKEIAMQYIKYIHPFELHLQSQSFQQTSQQNDGQSFNNSVESPRQPSNVQENQSQSAIRNASKDSSSPVNQNLPLSGSTDASKSNESAIPTSTASSDDKRKNSVNTKNSKVSKDTSNPKMRPKPHVLVPSLNSLYVPQKRKIEYKGGYDVQVLSRLGTEVDALSPEFPLFQELGTVNIHAITFALKSQMPGEIRQALDKLALVSSNPSQNIVLQKCPGLGDALGTVGLGLLQTLLLEKDTTQNHFSFQIEEAFGKRSDKAEDVGNDDEDDNDSDLITGVFNAFKNWNSAKTDIQFHVDSLTGDPVLETDNLQSSEKLEKFIQDDDNKYDDNAEAADKNTSLFKNIPNNQPFGFPNYLDLLDLGKNELESLHYSKRTNTESFWKEVLLDRLICVTMILRNLSFTDTNQTSIVEEPEVMKFIFGLIRALAEVPGLIHLKRRQLSIHKDLITLLANLGLSISFPSRADAFCVLLFILSFSPEPHPLESNISESKLQQKNLFFGEYNPLVHRYFGCAVDAFAKLIPRDPPNRQYFNEIFLNTCIDEEYLELLNRYLQKRELKPYEFLTKAFVFVTATIPRSDFRVIPRALESRIPLLQQSLLVAESLVSMVPQYGYFDENPIPTADESNDSALRNLELVVEKQKTYNVAFNWLEAVEGFGPTLLRASCVLGAVLYAQPISSSASNNPFAKFTRRSASILRALGQKAMAFEIINQKKGSNDNEAEIDTIINDSSAAYIPPGILPTVEALFGALLTTDMNETVVSQLCQLWEEGDDYVYSMMQNKGI